MSDTKLTRDIAFPIGFSEEGHPQLLRIRGDEGGPKEAMLGELRPVKDGVPIMGEVVQVLSDETDEGTPYFRCETVVEDPYKDLRSRKAYSIPTAKYQAGWDRVFGQKPDPSEIN